MKKLFHYQNDRIAILQEGGYPLAILTEDETNSLIKLCLGIHEQRLALFTQTQREIVDNIEQSE